MKINWGTGIVIAFILFVGVIATMVTISMKQDVNLVAKDYYKQELAYQDQIDRLENYNSLSVKPTLKKEGGNVAMLSFPETLRGSVDQGEVLFFRPSTSKMDKKWKLNLDDRGVQNIPLEGMSVGMWKVKLTWRDKEGKEYFNESILKI